MCGGREMLTYNWPTTPTTNVGPHRAEPSTRENTNGQKDIETSVLSAIEDSK
jgi:hypothetical protein